MTENPTHADGWVLKKPTSQSGKSWSGSSLQRRFLESRGYSVAYYADEASRRPKGTKPRGTFDLREVSTLRKSPDPTAPDTALELVVTCATSMRVSASMQRSVPSDEHETTSYEPTLPLSRSTTGSVLAARTAPL